MRHLARQPGARAGPKCCCARLKSLPIAADVCRRCLVVVAVPCPSHLRPDAFPFACDAAADSFPVPRTAPVARISRMKQLVLDIGLATVPTLDRFFSGPNRAALQHLRLAPGARRPAATPSHAAPRSPVPSSLWGGPGSGKTHLLQAVCQSLREQGASVGWLDPALSAPPDFDENWAAVVLDDVQSYDSARQALAFNWFVNAISPASGAQRWVLAAGSLPPAALRPREGLRSRLGGGQVGGRVGAGWWAGAGGCAQPRGLGPCVPTATARRGRAPLGAAPGGRRARRVSRRWGDGLHAAPLRARSGQPDATARTAPWLCPEDPARPHHPAAQDHAGAALMRRPRWLVSRHRSDAAGCAQPSERSARRITQPIPSGIGKRCNAALRFDGQRRPTDDR